jgi:N-acetylglucosamine kinase-like BadF-type ATPase
VALVCGAGVNALALTPDGRRGRYQALGILSGDWGGGEALGEAALGAAVRATDLRGPGSTLARSVPAELGFATPQDAADAIFHDRVRSDILLRLPPLVFAEARAGDAVALGLVDRQAAELASMATGLILRLRMGDLDTEVMCGGGLLESGEPLLLDAIAKRIHLVAPTARLIRLSAPPVLGAVLDGMRGLGLPGTALDRARHELESLALTHSPAS